MARIVGVDLPSNKRGEIALTYIFGIGRSSARTILEKAGIDSRLRSARPAPPDVPWSWKWRTRRSSRRRYPPSHSRGIPACSVRPRGSARPASLRRIQQFHTYKKPPINRSGCRTGGLQKSYESASLFDETAKTRVRGTAAVGQASMARCRFSMRQQKPTCGELLRSGKRPGRGSPFR